VGWGVLIGVVCIVLCFYFPRGYKRALVAFLFAITIYNIIATIRLRRALTELDHSHQTTEGEPE
jgi:hypothetical protein